MSPTEIGIYGTILLLILLFSEMPVGFSMALTGFVGFVYVSGLQAGLNLLPRDLFDTWSSYHLTTLPLFMLMGQISFVSGISRRLFDAANVVVGSWRGGLAVASIAACAGFSAISGSTSATAATMATVSLPEMRRFKYDMGLATGTLAAAGSLGILIPPSAIFIVYGILTEQSIGKLFAAGILPGIILSLLFVLAVYVQVLRNSTLAPAGEKTTFKQKIRSLSGVIETLFIFITVMGGIFFGFFTPTEAGGAGAFLCLLVGLARRQLTWEGFRKSLTDTARTSCMVLVIIAGAVIFGHFMAITRVPYDLANWVGTLPVSRYIIMMLIIFVYLIGGCFMDSLGMIMVTIPIFFPVATTLGFDPIWFGVIIVLITEMGVITPPVGINVYVVYGIADGVPLGTIFKGALPMLACLVICSLILILVPQIATFLPSLIR
jgi:C4-dicarboxylate transporter, DctM subunit